MNGEPLLVARGLRKSYGAVKVIRELDFDVHRGEVLGVLGPNGAGKTTLFNLISGDAACDAGEVRFAGRVLKREQPFQRCRMGIGRTYQIPRPFGGMTAYENLLVAAMFGGGLAERQAIGRSVEVLERCGLGPKADQLASRLPLLDRKRLELARALASGPQMLLLDEIAGGLTDEEAEELVRLVASLKLNQVTDRVDRTCAAGRNGGGRPRPGARLRPTSGGRDACRGDGRSRGPSRLHGNRMMSPGPPLLSTHALVARYGDFQALFGLDIEVAAGEIVALIGANGAGKSTFLKCLIGLLPSGPGMVRLDGEPISGLPPHRIVHRGIAMIPEGRRLFTGMSVEDNLRVAIDHARRRPRARRLDATARLRAVPGDCREAVCRGGFAFGWAAADGCDRPRAAVQPEAAAVRRVVARARAQRHSRGICRTAGHRRRRHRARARGAGRVARAAQLSPLVLPPRGPRHLVWTIRRLRPRSPDCRLLRSSSCRCLTQFCRACCSEALCAVRAWHGADVRRHAYRQHRARRFSGAAGVLRASQFQVRSSCTPTLQ